MSFGEMPIANSFVNTEKKSNIFMKCLPFCENCFTFQLLDVPEPEKMFNENYAYLASTSKEMQAHWSQLAEKICKEFKCSKSLLLWK